MSFDKASVLVDGTLQSAFVWICVLAAGLVVAVPILVAHRLLYRVAGWRSLLFAAAAVASGLALLGGQSLVQLTANLIASAASFSDVEICLMPTVHPVRDSIPAAVSLVVGSAAALKRRHGQRQ